MLSDPEQTTALRRGVGSCARCFVARIAGLEVVPPRPFIMDDAVGGLVAKLREFNLEEQTLILFAGDNGAKPWRR